MITKYEIRGAEGRKSIQFSETYEGDAILISIMDDAGRLSNILVDKVGWDEVHDLGWKLKIKYEYVAEETSNEA